MEGRRYTGIVMSGGKRAAQLGFPTANIPLEDDSVSGIFAGRVSVAGRVYDAVVYADRKRKLIEAHLFGFFGNLYGKDVAVVLLHKLREDREFSGDGEMRAAIAADIAAAHAYFKK
ncbi:riboflavin kinase [Candidatus Kaiserbacteria bacterium]|nr:riboflavin kinase [Candidatus Kaiserbacteria bacterium]